MVRFLRQYPSLIFGRTLQVQLGDECTVMLSMLWAALMVDEKCRRNGQFTGFPVMGMKWQRMESHALRSAYKMKKEQKGILVRHVQPTYETAKHLKPDDIIMRFDGIQVASDGTVPFRSALTAL